MATGEIKVKSSRFGTEKTFTTIFAEPETNPPTTLPAVIVFDNPQGLKDDPYEYINYGFQATLERCYSFNPTAGIPDDQAGHILGGQGNNWSEYTWNGSELEWKMWPRMCALAECLWTQPENKSWECFKARVPAMRQRLIRELHINCAPIE